MTLLGWLDESRWLHSSLALLIWVGVLGPPSDTATTAIESGHGTHLIRLFGAGAFQNASQVPGAFFVSGDRGAPPVWDGSDEWPIVEQPVGAVLFPDGYIAGSTWVSGVGAGQTIAIDLYSTPAVPKLRIHDPRIALRLEAASPPALRGMIAGVMDPEEFLAELAPLAGAIDFACDENQFALIAASVRGYSDIVLDGTNGDPSLPCTGISAGIGFEAELAELGSVVPAELEPSFPCP